MLDPWRAFLSDRRVSWKRNRQAILWPQPMG